MTHTPLPPLTPCTPPEPNMNAAYQHGYDDAKYGFTYVPDDIESYQAGYKAYLEELKK